MISDDVVIFLAADLEPGAGETVAFQAHARIAETG